MNEILIIPDIHGRSFWKEPCKEWKESIVFLGDYHDPYSEITKLESRKNLRELTEFVVERRIKNPSIDTICLLGNHDLTYFTHNYRCRYDDIHEAEVKEYLTELDLQISYQIDNYLFTHAGVSRDWLELHNLTVDDLNNIKDYDILEEIPKSRGGYDKYGSCVWNSLSDYAEEIHIPDYFQIFGHTWGGRTNPVIKKDFAMLDCCKPFVLKDKEIIL